MRYVEIGVLQLMGNVARVRAVSLLHIDGEPEASIELRIHARQPLSDAEAKRVATRYVNVLKRPKTPKLCP